MPDWIFLWDVAMDAEREIVFVWLQLKFVKQTDKKLLTPWFVWTQHENDTNLRTLGNSFCGRLARE